MMTYDNLTDGQKSAIESIRKWIQEGANAMSFTGAAGTGKTTTIKFLLDILMGEYSVLLLAPTHASRGILSNMSGYDVSTTHSALGLRPDVDLADYNPDKPEFAQTGKCIVNNYDIVIQEEASMINQELMDLLVNSTNCIIFMGDECQLPPIGADSCPALSLEYKTTLTMVMRQKSNNTLLKVLSLMRCIISQKCGYNYQDNSVELIEQLGLTGMPSSCLSLIQQVWNSNASDGSICFDPKVHLLIKDWEISDIDRDKYLFTAFTNKKVDDLNRICAELLDIKPFREGFRVIFTKTFKSGTLADITNNTRGRVLRIDPTIFQYKIGKETINCIKIIFDIDGKEYSVLTPTTGNLDNYIIKHGDIMNNASKSKKQDSWDEFECMIGTVQPFKDYLNKEFSKELESRFIYVDTRKRPKQYIKPGYAITVHKSQGSTIPTMVVAINDIAQSRDLADKLLYVALSRASEKVYIV